MTIGSAYKSSKAREKAISSYDDSLAHWQVPYEARVVDTSFGETHVIISGSPQAKPLVLLHGGGGNSTMWLYNVAVLAKEYRVFAVDIVGEAGKSAGKRPSYKSDGHAIWLNETFNALGIKQAVLCGASLGGMIAHKFALLYPQSVSALVLLAPPSLLKMRPSFLFKAVFANIFPTAYFARKFLNYMCASAASFPKSGINAFVIQFQSYKPNLDAIPVITDEELAKLPSNTLVLVGENEVLYDPKSLATRIHSVAPSVKVEIIPGAKHTISVDQPEIVNARLLQFALIE